MTTQSDDDDEYPEPADFDPMISEQRGERDLALFFDVRWVHGLAPDRYIEKVLARVGAGVQGRWARYGRFRSAQMTVDELWQLFVATARPVRPFDFPGALDPLAVAVLEGVRREHVEQARHCIARDIAYVGWADVSFVGDLRTLLSQELDWR